MVICPVGSAPTKKANYQLDRTVHVHVRVHCPTCDIELNGAEMGNNEQRMKRSTRGHLFLSL